MATTTPERENILANLKILFQGITVTNGYRTNVKEVTRQYSDYTEIDIARMPVIIISDGIENRTYQGKRVIHNFMVMLKLYAYSTTQVSSKINNLLKDVEEILATDIDLGVEQVGEVKILSVDTDEGFLDPHSIMEITLEIIYYTLEVNR